MVGGRGVTIVMSGETLKERVAWVEEALGEWCNEEGIVSM